MARYNYADSSLRVIGVAVGLSFIIQNGWNDPPNMNYFSNYQTDYIRLYEVDSTTNELVLLAEKPLDTNVVCYLPDYLPLYGSKPHVPVGREVVVLGWESEGSSQWELKVAKEDTGLDSVEALGCTNDVMPLYELDTASWYVATVRSICGQNRISEWSDTIRFFVPGDTTSTDPTDPTEGISNVVERYTYLMPNPASGQVSVMSSFRIDLVEIYTLAGQRILQENAGGLSAQIDISALAQGTYIVRTYTDRGVSNKRLVVR